MHTSNHQIVDYTPVLEAEFGKPGTPEYEQSLEEAYAYYSGQVLLEARRQAHLTQAELADKAHTTKSYISKVENGLVNPSVGMFYRLVAALGMRVEIVSPIG